MENDGEFAGPELLKRLEAFVRGSEAGEGVLPWADRLSEEDRERLCGDLAVVLSEPAVTGESVDWKEIRSILQEGVESAGWEGALIEAEEAPRSGTFAVEIRPREEEALASASEAVQRTARLLLDEFLPAYPTAAELLPRGELKKLKDRDVWQIDLPDGYRLRYLVDKPRRTVHVVYLGPHLDGKLRGREQSVRIRLHAERRGDGE